VGRAGPRCQECEFPLTDHPTCLHYEKWSVENLCSLLMLCEHTLIWAKQNWTRLNCLFQQSPSWWYCITVCGGKKWNMCSSKTAKYIQWNVSLSLPH